MKYDFNAHSVYISSLIFLSGAAGGPPKACVPWCTAPPTSPVWPPLSLLHFMNYRSKNPDVRTFACTDGIESETCSLVVVGGTVYGSLRDLMSSTVHVGKIEY